MRMAAVLLLRHFERQRVGDNVVAGDEDEMK